MLRCLSNYPSRRMQSALDIRNELEQLKREMDSGELFVDARPAPIHAWTTNKVWWTAAAAIVILLLGSAAGWMLSGPRVAPSPRLTNPRQLTFTAGVESFPSWSPDGGRLATARIRAGTMTSGSCRQPVAARGTSRTTLATTASPRGHPMATRSHLFPIAIPIGAVST